MANRTCGRIYYAHQLEGVTTSEDYELIENTEVILVRGEEGPDPRYIAAIPTTAERGMTTLQWINDKKAVETAAVRYVRTPKAGLRLKEELPTNWKPGEYRAFSVRNIPYSILVSQDPTLRLPFKPPSIADLIRPHDKTTPAPAAISSPRQVRDSDAASAAIPAATPNPDGQGRIDTQSRLVEFDLAFESPLPSGDRLSDISPPRRWLEAPSDPPIVSKEVVAMKEEMTRMQNTFLREIRDSQETNKQILNVLLQQVTQNARKEANDVGIGGAVGAVGDQASRGSDVDGHLGHNVERYMQGTGAFSEAGSTDAPNKKAVGVDCAVGTPEVQQSAKNGVDQGVGTSETSEKKKKTIEVKQKDSPPPSDSSSTSSDYNDSEYGGDWDGEDEEPPEKQPPRPPGDDDLDDKMRADIRGLRVPRFKEKEAKTLQKFPSFTSPSLIAKSDELEKWEEKNCDLIGNSANGDAGMIYYRFIRRKASVAAKRRYEMTNPADISVWRVTDDEQAITNPALKAYDSTLGAKLREALREDDKSRYPYERDRVIVSLTEGTPAPYSTIELMVFKLLKLFSAKPSERAELDRITSWFNIPDKLCDLYKGLKKFNARWELKKIIAPFSRGLVVDDFRENLRFIHLSWSKSTGPDLASWRAEMSARYEADSISHQTNVEILQAHFAFVLEKTKRLVVSEEKCFVAEGAHKSQAAVAGGVFQLGVGKVKPGKPPKDDAPDQEPHRDVNPKRIQLSKETCPAWEAGWCSKGGFCLMFHPPSLKKPNECSVCRMTGCNTNEHELVKRAEGKTFTVVINGAVKEMPTLRGRASKNVWENMSEDKQAKLKEAMRKRDQKTIDAGLANLLPKSHIKHPQFKKWKAANPNRTPCGRYMESGEKLDDNSKKEREEGERGEKADQERKEKKKEKDKEKKKEQKRLMRVGRELEAQQKRDAANAAPAGENEKQQDEVGDGFGRPGPPGRRQKVVRPVKSVRQELYGFSDSGSFRHAISASEAEKSGIELTGSTTVEAFNGEERVHEARKDGYTPELVVDVEDTRLIAENPLCQDTQVKVLRGPKETLYVEMTDEAWDGLVVYAKTISEWHDVLVRENSCDYMTKDTYGKVRSLAGLQPLKRATWATGSTVRGVKNNNMTGSPFAHRFQTALLLSSIASSYGVEYAAGKTDGNKVYSCIAGIEEEHRAWRRSSPEELSCVFAKSGEIENKTHSSHARMMKVYRRNESRWVSWSFMNVHDRTFDLIYTPIIHRQRLQTLVTKAGLTMLEVEAIWRNALQDAITTCGSRWTAEKLRWVRARFEAELEEVGDESAMVGRTKAVRPYDRCLNHSIHNPNCEVCRRIAQRLMTHWRGGSSLSAGRFVGSLVIYMDLKTFPKSARNNRYMLYASIYLEAVWQPKEEDGDDEGGMVDRDGELGHWRYTGRIDVDVPIPRKDERSLTYGWQTVRAEGRIPDQQRAYVHTDNESAIVLSGLLELLAAQNCQVINSIPKLHDAVAESIVKTRSQAGNRITFGANLGRLFWDNAGEVLWLWGNTATYVELTDDLEEIIIPWKPLITLVPEFKMGGLGYSVIPGDKRAGEPWAQPICATGLARRTSLGVRILFWQKRYVLPKTAAKRRGAPPPKDAEPGDRVESWGLSQTVIPYNMIEWDPEGKLAFERVVTNLVEEYRGVGPFESAVINDSLLGPDTTFEDERPGKTSWACCLDCAVWRTTTRAFERANDAGERVARCELIPRATSDLVEEFWDCKDPPEDWADEDEEELPGLRDEVVVLDVDAHASDDPPDIGNSSKSEELPLPPQKTPWNRDATDFSDEKDVEKLRALLATRGGSLYLPNLRAYWKKIPKDVLKDKAKELGGCVLKISQPGHYGVGCEACIAEDFGYEHSGHAAACRRHSGDPNTTPMEHFYECEDCYARTTSEARKLIDEAWENDRRRTTGPDEEPKGKQGTHFDLSVFDTDAVSTTTGGSDDESDSQSTSNSIASDDQDLKHVEEEADTFESDTGDCKCKLAASSRLSMQDSAWDRIVRASMRAARKSGVRAERLRAKRQMRRRQKNIARMRDALEKHAEPICADLDVEELEDALQRLVEIQETLGFDRDDVAHAADKDDVCAGSMKLTKPVTPSEAKNDYCHLDWEASDNKEAANMRNYEVFGMPRIDNASTREEAGERFNVSDVIKVRAVKSAEKHKTEQIAKTRGVVNGKGTKAADGELAVFAPYGLLPASLREVRLAICIGCLLGFWIGQGDIEAAYINASMPAGTYVRLNDFVYSCMSARAQAAVDALLAAGHKRSDILVELLKALYGHEQAGTRWHLQIEGILKDIGFKCYPDTTSAIWFLYEGGRLICLFVLYVDDFIASGRRATVAWLEKELTKRGIVLSKWGKIEEMLGCSYRVTQTPIANESMETVVEIDMRAYTQNMTKEFEAKHDLERWVRLHPAFRRDLVPGSIPEMEEADAPAGIMADDAPRYVGQVTWAMRSGVAPAAQACNAVAGSLARWKRSTDSAMMKLMAWMKLVANSSVLTGTVSTEDAAPLVGRLVLFVDADWAGDKQTRKSTSAYAIYFVGPSGTFILLDWATRRQSAVSLSSGEAEVSALQTGLRELVNIAGVFRAAGLKPAVSVLCDSNVAISVAATGISSKMRYSSQTQGLSAQWIKETLALLRTRANKVDSEANVADIGTKPVSPEDFSKYSNFMGFTAPTNATAICSGVHASAFGAAWRCHVPVARAGQKCDGCTRGDCSCWSCGADTKTPADVRARQLIPT